MKINKNTLIIACILTFFTFAYVIQKNHLSGHFDAVIQKPIEPDLVKNLLVDNFEKNDTAELYKTRIENEISQIWKEIEEVTKVSLNDCLRYKSQTYNKYLTEIQELQNSFKALPALDTEIMKIIELVLKDFNIDSHSIFITPFSHFCPAACDDCTLFVNEKLFKSLSPLAQKFCIAHELHHFIYQDNSLKQALEALTNFDRTSLPSDHPIAKLSRMLELRADVYAALQGSEYAQGYREFIDKTIAIIGDGKGITHPKNSLRLAYADQIKSIQS